MQHAAPAPLVRDPGLVILEVQHNEHVCMDTWLIPTCRCISCRHALAHKALQANVHLVHSQLRKPALHEGSKEP